MIAGLSGEIVALLVLTAFVAGFIDAIAGGGGLLTIPAFLLAGVSPAQALATNKLQSVFGSATATYRFSRAKLIDWKDGWFCAVCSFLGACLGAYAITLIDPSFLRSVIPFLLVTIALYFIFAPNLNDEPRRHVINAKQHGLAAGGGIGFYDGLFGPGTGSFFAISFVTLLGYGIKKATAHTKLMNFSSNLGALVVFLVSGKAIIALGLVMAVGQIAGAYLGVKTVVKHGARVVRPLLVVVCCAMALKLLLS